MKKIWQKSLASMVSAALCLTAFVGCLTVSAVKGSATITVGKGSAKPGAEVVVPVTIDANTEQIDGVAVALFDLQFDTTNLTVTKVSAPDNVAYCAEPKYADGNGTIAVDPATKSIKILATSKDTTGQNYPLHFASMTVNVTFLVDQNATAKEYPITILNAQACDAGTKTETIVDTLTKYEYADNEDFIALTLVPGNVTVTPATTEPIAVPLGCSHTLSLGNSIAITYSFRDKDVGTGTKVSEYCARVYAVITKERYAADGDLSMDTTIDCTLDSASGMYTFKYKGLAAKEMGKTVTARIYGEDASGNVIMISKSTDDYGVLKYATSSVGFSGNDTDLKTCLADILNYGAAAQVYFGYNTSDLVNARDSVSSYVAEFSTVNDVAWKDNQQVSGDESFQVSPGVSLNSSIDMFVNVNPKRLSSYDLNTIKVVFSFHNSKENKDYNIAVPYGDVDNFSGGTVYSFYCRELAAAQVNEDVYIAVYSGDQKISKTTKYSVETYCARLTANSSDQNFIDLCQSIMKYGNSAKIVLGY